MPKELDDRVKKIMKNGASKSVAYAVATKQLQKAGVLKKGTNKKR